MEICAKIKTLRETKGITQREMEKLLGVSHGTYCNWESGLHDIKVSKLREIAEILEVEVKDLFDDTKESRIEVKQDFKESTINGAVIILTNKESADRLAEILKNNL